jgi:hypothetical protein
MRHAILPFFRKSGPTLTGRKAEEGLALSLLHFLGTDDDFFALAPAFVNQRSDNLLCRDQAFRLQTRALETPMEFVFGSQEFGYLQSDETASRVWIITSHQVSETESCWPLYRESGWLQTTIANFSKTKNWDGLIHGEPLAPSQFAFVILNQAP